MEILIVYASKYGAAQRCAQMISEKLKGDISLINLKETKQVDCSKYDTIIIGGSIYAGNIQKEVKEFCTKNLSSLKNKKIGLFVSCMGDQEASTFIQNSFPQELVNIASAKVGCGGILNFKKMNFFERFIIKIISNSKANEKGTLPPVNGKDTINTITEQKINDFVLQINM